MTTQRDAVQLLTCIIMRLCVCVQILIRFKLVLQIQAGQCGNQIGAKFWEVSMFELPHLH